jgi:hypothetical protein
VITDDIFTPAPLIPDAASYISRLAGNKDDVNTSPLELALINPSPYSPLDPDRGVINDISPEGNGLPSGVPQPTPSELSEPRGRQIDSDTNTTNADTDTNTPNGDSATQLAEAEDDDTEQVMWQTANLVVCRTEPLSREYDNAQESNPTHAIF